MQINQNSPAVGGIDIPRGAAIAAIAVLPLVFFFPAVLGQVVLAPNDGLWQNLGVRVLGGRMMLAGELPLWDPFIFAGMPLAASVYPGSFYPPNWLFAMLPAKLAMNVVVLTTYHLALAGAWLFARRLGMSRLAALVAGMAFAFGGFMVAHLGHTSRIAAAAWMPWILLAIEELYRRASWRWVALGSFFVLLQMLAGEPQMILYTVLVAGTYALFSLTLREAPGSRVAFACSTAAMAVCGLLLSMIQLGPQKELLELGERAGISYEYFSQFSYPPQQILNLIFPYFFGGAATPPYRIHYWGQWNSAECCGYVGTVALLLAVTAFLARRRDRMVVFWTCWAVLSMVLAFGGNLPFGVNRLLYQVPVYNLFRAPGRNMVEFTFALGILAGLGFDSLTRLDAGEVRRGLNAAARAIFAAALIGVVVYGNYLDLFVTQTPLPAGAGSMSNPEVLVPLALLAAGFVCLFLLVRTRSLPAAGAAVLVMLLELMSFGFFYEWKLFDIDLEAKFRDKPPVKFIKDREPDLNQFRIASYTQQPFAYNADEIDYPNVSVVRGLQSINGYDALRLQRVADIAGDLTIEGMVTDTRLFSAAHAGANLLNVKYLMVDRMSFKGNPSPLEAAGIRFFDPMYTLVLGGGLRTRFKTGVTANSLAVISTLTSSDEIPDGAPVARITIRTRDGRTIEQEIQAGRDSSEWAYERPDVKARIKHKLAGVIESWDAGGFQGHRYVARFNFDRVEIESIDIAHLPFAAATKADLVIARMSLHDDQEKKSYPLGPFNLDGDRWQNLASFGDVDIYENRAALPRAWIAPAISVMPSHEVLETVKSGKMIDGSAFDPRKTVLLEREVFENRTLPMPMWQPGSELTVNGAARVTGYRPHAIEVEAETDKPSFLVLSEIYYRGWEAWVDGARAPVERVDYTLRGVQLQPGKHRVSFKYMAPSLRSGAIYAAIGLLVLAAGAWVSRKRK